MTERVVNLLTLTAAGTTAGTESPLVDTLPGENLSDGVAARKCRVNVDITAISGAGATLDVFVVAEINGVNVTLGGFSSLTAVGNSTFVFEVVPRNLKLIYIISGTTPSVTATVSSLRI